MENKMKLAAGIFLFIMDVVAFAFGIVLILTGVGVVTSQGGEGNIEVVIDKIGKITGINGNLVIFLAGIALVLVSVTYALKAFKEAAKTERGPRDAIRHFAP
jgi:hypothetical protein